MIKYYRKDIIHNNILDLVEVTDFTTSTMSRITTKPKKYKIFPEKRTSFCTDNFLSMLKILIIWRIIFMMQTVS